jgi:hypothetical protein
MSYGKSRYGGIRSVKLTPPCCSKAEFLKELFYAEPFATRT